MIGPLDQAVPGEAVGPIVPRSMSKLASLKRRRIAHFGYETAIAAIPSDNGRCCRAITARPSRIRPIESPGEAIHRRHVPLHHAKISQQRISQQQQEEQHQRNQHIQVAMTASDARMKQTVIGGNFMRKSRKIITNLGTTHNMRKISTGHPKKGNNTR